MPTELPWPSRAKKNFHEIGHNAKLPHVARTVFRCRRRAFIRLRRGFAAWNKPGIPDAFCHLREGKTIHATLHVAAGIAILQTAREYLIERGS